jgi:hypothetical protein
MGIVPLRVPVDLRREADLTEVVHALGLPSPLAGHLNGGQQQADQRGNDCDHDEKFHERHALAT